MTAIPKLIAASAPGYEWTELRLMFLARPQGSQGFAPTSLALSRREAAILINGGFADATVGAKQELGNEDE